MVPKEAPQNVSLWVVLFLQYVLLSHTSLHLPGSSARVGLWLLGQFVLWGVAGYLRVL